MCKPVKIRHAERLQMTLDDAFGLGLGAGLGQGNFKFLGMNFPCIKSLVGYNFQKTSVIPHTPWAALAQTTFVRTNPYLWGGFWLIRNALGSSQRFVEEFQDGAVCSPHFMIDKGIFKSGLTSSVGGVGVVRLATGI